MLEVLVGLLTAVAVFGILGGIMVLVSGSRGRVSARVQSFVAAAAPPPPKVAPPPVKRRRPALLDQLDARWTQTVRGQTLAQALDRAGAPLTVGTFILLRAGAAVAVAGLGIVLAPVSWWLVLVPGLLVGQALPPLYLRTLTQRRMQRLDAQLPDLLTMLAGSIRAGNSFFQALDRTAREAEEPSRSEYGQVVRDISLGVNTETALRDLVARVPTEDVEMLVTAISIQQQTGGNLGNILDLIASIARERHRIQGEIKALSAQQEYSAYFLAALPLGLAGMLYLINPTYIGQIFQPGWVLMMPCSVVVLLVVGFVVMRRIAKIEI